MSNQKPCSKCNGTGAGIMLECAECDGVGYVHSTPVIDLDQSSWESIKRAASESTWIPPEYSMNDWVSDICTFLRERPTVTNAKSSEVTDGHIVAVPDNLLTHRNSWLGAFERLIELEPESFEPDEDDKAFWQSELKAMKDMYADLDTLLSTPTPPSADQAHNNSGIKNMTLNDVANRANAFAKRFKAGMVEHDFYKTDDVAAPNSIKDRNGEVVLSLCKKCNRAESELTPFNCVEPPDSAAPELSNDDWLTMQLRAACSWGKTYSEVLIGNYWQECRDGYVRNVLADRPTNHKTQRITEQDAREIWVHGYDAGHNEGIGCGHPLSSRCRHTGENEFDADDISELLAKLNEHREADYKVQEWQPIETAPKDGSRIWVTDGKKITVALWCKGNFADYWQDWFLSSGVDKKNLIAWMPVPDAKAAIAQCEGESR
jgi:hypothetical protein